MKKINNKGFAISTMLYGLLIIMVLVMSSIMAIMAFNRTQSKNFVDTTTRELEEGLGLKISDSNLSIDSVDNTIYIGEEYDLSYTFRINKELEYGEYYASWIAMNQVYLEIGGIVKPLTSEEFKIEKNNGYTNLIVTKKIKLEEHDKDKLDESKGVVINITKNLFLTELPVDLYIIEPISELNVSKEKANINVTNVEDDQLAYAKVGIITIDFNKNGKILELSDVECMLSFDTDNASRPQLTDGDYEVIFDAIGSKYQLIINIFENKWKDSSFNVQYYPIRLSLKIDGEIIPIETDLKVEQGGNNNIYFRN